MNADSHAPSNDADDAAPLIPFVFRPLDAFRAGPTGGELCVLPAELADRARRDLAELALQRGVPAFWRAAGPIRKIVLPVTPTIDDTLAAEFLR